MKSILLLSLGSHATAQFLTAAPVFNQVVNAAIGVDDPEFKVCTALGAKLDKCIVDAGGVSGLEANLDDALGCACCEEKSPISAQFLTCGDYFGSMSLGLDVGAFTTLYSVCSESAACGGGGGKATSASASATGSASSGFAPASSVTQSGAPSVTSPPSQGGGSGGEDSCKSMSDIFLQCISKTPGFERLGYKSQAECYCCGGLNDAFWTDSLDQQASSCWNWAESSQLGTTWNYAKTFATFCDNFSDACDGGVSPKTKDSDDQATDATNTSDNNDEAKETGSSNNEDEKKDDDSAAGNVLPGSMVAIAVVIGAMLML